MLVSWPRSLHHHHDVIPKLSGQREGHGDRERERETQRETQRERERAPLGLLVMCHERTAVLHRCNQSQRRILAKLHMKAEREHLKKSSTLNIMINDDII